MQSKGQGEGERENISILMNLLAKAGDTTGPPNSCYLRVSFIQYQLSKPSFIPEAALTHGRMPHAVLLLPAISPTPCLPLGSLKSQVVASVRNVAPGISKSP